MRRILISLVFLIPGLLVMAQSPHGEDFVMDCAACHDPSGWRVSLANVTFDHGTTHFDLEGTHALIDCRECHTSFVFDEVENDCVSCHMDVHSQSVGNDCVRCHTTDNWLVDEIPELHEENGFPLLGVHTNLSCVECHINETNLRFDRIGNDCASCHLDDYQATQNPSHVAGGYPTDCLPCHSPLSLDTDWQPARFDIHDEFYALNGAHAQIADDCAACHMGDYNNTPNTCFGCHQDDYNMASDPNHAQLSFSTNCIPCHTEDAWEPSTFDHDGAYFPIFSGPHQGVWDNCMECHTTPNSFGQFSCVGCHREPNTGNKHIGVQGYVHESNACFSCHPLGEAD